jgi:hypothetical protein
VTSLLSSARPFPLTPEVAREHPTATGGASGASAPSGAASAPQARGDALPCLNRNNSIIIQAPDEGLSQSHRKTAAALSWNVAAFAERFGLGRIGFFTLTFADHVLDGREAQRRYNSLAVNVLAVRYPDGYIRVLERQKSGRIHYHLLVILPVDIREGVDFGAFSQGDYRTAGRALRSEWAFWRHAARAHGFGRTELLPVKSETDAIAKYVGKYIAKHIGQREERDKGLRLVSYSKAARTATTRFAWVSRGAKEWRRKIAMVVGASYERGLIPSPTFEGMRSVYGPKWAYKLREAILSMP